MALETTPTTTGKPRLTSVDALRGLVMVFMCLDHTREFFGDLRVQPENLATTTPLLFGTRWITHFCAPTFIFLAGVSAWLYQKRVDSKHELSRFLWTRGLWLIFLEFTVVYFGWFFRAWPFPLMFIVIAAIGFCMIVLSGLIWLPFRLLVVIGLTIVCLHNTLDPIESEDLGSLAWIWRLLHDGGRIERLSMDIGYPVLAWIGVIVCGYCFGSVLNLPARKRWKVCVVTGGAGCILFLVLRTINVYGDPSPRETFGVWATDVMSFLRCTKYPPSLLYLLMTLGPALITLGIFDLIEQKNEGTPAFLQALTEIGRVPLFFYVMHLYLIHAASIVLYLVVRGELLSPVYTAFQCFMNETEFPAAYGFPLWVVYPAWICMLAILWPMCRWYGSVKRRSRHPIWSYL